MRWFASLLLLFGCASSLFAEEPAEAPDRQEYFELYALLAEAVAQIELNHAEPVDRRRLFEAAIDGMLRDLDPHSRYLEPEAFRAYRQKLSEHQVGVGIEMAVRDGQLVVLSVAEGSPASEAGVAPGDMVLSVGDADAERLGLAGVERQLENPPGAGVTLEIASRGGAQRTVSLTPRRLRAPTVVGFGRTEDRQEQFFARRTPPIGYVRVTGFNDRTASDLRTRLFELRERGAEAVVVDLRSNAGGLLTAAVDVADLFLDGAAKGDAPVIVTTEGRHVKRRVWRATAGGPWTDRPVAVLVNQLSASGSEVVAAALQDNGRAAVVGERTWGKASVQNLIEIGGDLPGGPAGLKLTTATYHRPSGAKLHRLPGDDEDVVWGVAPDEGLAVGSPSDANGQVDGVDPQLDRAVEAIVTQLGS